MAFISELLGKHVADMDGDSIGTLTDIVALHRTDVQHPQVTALAVKHAGGTRLVSYADVAVLIAPAIPLNKRQSELTPYIPSDDVLYLARDILDKQIIDTNGMRVVRVNDLELVRVNGSFYVANLDVGGLGLLRRLGLAKAALRVSSRFGRTPRPNVIAWQDTELLPGNQPMRLKVASDRMAELHPADLAEIISGLSRADSSKLLDTLDVKTVADTLETIEPDFQASLVEDMADEKVADLLEEMAPDAAADLLGELPEGRSADILNLMQDEDAQDVRALLNYPVDSAGGLMNTEFIAVHPNLTAAEAMEQIRANAHEAETIFYVYVTDEAEQLVGVFSLQNLVLADPQKRVGEFMHHRVVSVQLMDEQDQVAQVVAKYNLLAVPVVDSQMRLRGIVTADDALDKIIPTTWKKRIPRLYH